MKSYYTIAALLGLANASGGGYNYNLKGADWGDIDGFRDCKKVGGSPINLSTNLSEYQYYDVSKDRL